VWIARILIAVLWMRFFYAEAIAFVPSLSP